MFNQQTNPQFSVMMAVLSALVIIFLYAYWPSFAVPFYLDDRISIVENELLKTGSFGEVWRAYGMRSIGYISFWLNVQLTDLNLKYFHLTNVAIHFVNAITIYFLVKLVSIKIKPSVNNKHTVGFAFAVATLWLLHPLNVQAVTYIVQRLASLVTLFYLLSLFSYLKLRLESFSKVWFALLCLFFVLGALTKQNFFSLIAFILILEVIFLKSIKIKYCIYIALFSIFFVALLYPFFPELFERVSSLTKETTAISRFDYFITQLEVIWRYIFKLFLPINLQLDMGVSLVKSSTGLHFVALLGHVILITAAIWCRRIIPLFTFGILFYYSAHSIESFIIPITDLAFEHRTYLPNVGLILAMCAIIYHIFHKNLMLVFTLFVGITCVYMYLTHQRNVLWQDPYAFYQNEYKLAPDSPRAMASLAIEMMKQGRLGEAEALLLKSVNQNLSEGRVTVTSLNNLMLVLFQQKKYQAAVNTAMISLKYIKRPREKSLILTTIAYGYIQMGWCDFALGLSKRASKLDPSNEKAKDYMLHCKT